METLTSLAILINERFNILKFSLFFFSSAVAVRDLIWFIGGCCADMSELELYSGENSVSNAIGLEALSGRYDFAACYYPQRSDRQGPL